MTTDPKALIERLESKSPVDHVTRLALIQVLRELLAERGELREGTATAISHGPLELKPVHFRLLARGVSSRYIGLSDNSGIRMGERAALGELMRAGLVRFTEDKQPPGPPTPTPCEITDAGRALLETQEKG